MSPNLIVLYTSRVLFIKLGGRRGKVTFRDCPPLDKVNNASPGYSSSASFRGVIPLAFLKSVEFAYTEGPLYIFMGFLPPKYHPDELI